MGVRRVEQLRMTSSLASTAFVAGGVLSVMGLWGASLRNELSTSSEPYDFLQVISLTIGGLALASLVVAFVAAYRRFLSTSGPGRLGVWLMCAGILLLPAFLLGLYLLIPGFLLFLVALKKEGLISTSLAAFALLGFVSLMYMPGSDLVPVAPFLLAGVFGAPWIAIGVSLGRNAPR